MDEINVRIGYHMFTVVITPASCRCGGSHMWMVKRPSGAFMSLGCICHTQLEAAINKELGYTS